MFGNMWERQRLTVTAKFQRFTSQHCDDVLVVDQRLGMEDARFFRNVCGRPNG
jgi:hypothetical protein